MANTYNLIASTTIVTPVSVFKFMSIPQTYTDLVIRVSARNSGSAPSLGVYFQPYSFSIGRTTLTGDGSTAVSSRDSNDAGIFLDYEITGTNQTANTFNSMEFYIPNYAVSGTHQTSTFAVTENNATAAYITVNASLDTNSTTYTQIDFNPGNNFVAGSSFYLYGIKNS
jgi:hypothetical protein